MTRQDWRRIVENPWLDQATGYWRLSAGRQMEYDITIRFRKTEFAGRVNLIIGEKSYQTPITAGQIEVFFKKIAIGQGSVDLQAWLETNDHNKVGSWQVELTAL